jgi:hypothetical protein
MWFWYWGVNRGTVVTFPGSCMLHTFWHVREAIKPPYSCVRINKSRSTSLQSPTILHSVFIESCSNRCQASAMFPFSREDEGILGRPLWSAEKRDSGSMSTPTPKHVYPYSAKQQVGIRQDGHWPYYTTSLGKSRIVYCSRHESESLTLESDFRQAVSCGEWLIVWNIMR